MTKYICGNCGKENTVRPVDPIRFALFGFFCAFSHTVAVADVTTAAVVFCVTILLCWRGE